MNNKVQQITPDGPALYLDMMWFTVAVMLPQVHLEIWTCGKGNNKTELQHLHC